MALPMRYEPLPEERPKGSVLLYFLDVLGEMACDDWSAEETDMVHES